MGERWTITGLRLSRVDRERTLGSWVTNHLEGPQVPEGESIEVVPASALKRCEEQDWHQVANDFQRAMFDERARAESAEAKCERLEAAIERALERSAQTKTFPIPSWAVALLDDALSTPKTEGER